MNSFYPNVRQTGEFRNLTAVDWTLDLDKKAGFGLKIGLSNEFDSLAEEGVDRYDFKYTGSLVWKLGNE